MQLYLRLVQFNALAFHARITYELSRFRLVSICTTQKIIILYLQYSQNTSLRNKCQTIGTISTAAQKLYALFSVRAILNDISKIQCAI